MPSRRELIRMTAEEVDSFLAGTHQELNVASIGLDGRPHLVAMWYGFFLDGSPGFWTFAKSQKVVNLRRDPRVTCLVETGERYEELRGAELVATATVTQDRADLLEIGRSVLQRYVPSGVRLDPADLTDDVVLQAAAKRVAVRLNVECVVSWDHRKLDGRY